eukprot:42715-Prorocentrum_minimum.AAC.3
MSAPVTVALDEHRYTRCIDALLIIFRACGSADRLRMSALHVVPGTDLLASVQEALRGGARTDGNEQRDLGKVFTDNVSQEPEITHRLPKRVRNAFIVRVSTSPPVFRPVAQYISLKCLNTAIISFNDGTASWRLPTWANKQAASASASDVICATLPSGRISWAMQLQTNADQSLAVRFPETTYC